MSTTHKRHGTGESSARTLSRFPIESHLLALAFHADALP